MDTNSGPLSARAIVRDAGFGFVAMAAFPRLTRRLRRFSRLEPRLIAVHVAWRTALLFTIHQWLLPWAKHMAQKRERAEEELRAELGREPTEDEVLAHLGVSCEL